MTLGLRYAARSDVGLLRDGNEDSGYAGPRLLVVADGMGGHAAGEVASSVAVATLVVLDEDVPGPNLLDALADAVQTAQSHLRDMVAGDPDLAGMGTTMTALLWSPPRLALAHIGDTRCYRFRDGELLQLTHDHTFVQSLVDEGRITAEEAGHHPQRSLITRALDGRGEADPDLSVREARLGDRYLICSDGLCGVVTDDTIAATLALPDPEEACDVLVRLALRGGGPDNVTVVVADIVRAESPPSQPPVVVGAASDPRERASAVSDQSPAARAAALRRRPEAPTSRPRAPRRWPRRLLAGLAVAALLAGLSTAAYAFARRQYFVGADDGRVAVWRGLDAGVGTLRLSSVAEHTDVRIEDLPVFTRSQVRDHISATGLPHARRIVDRLRQEAADCVAQRGGAALSPRIDCGDAGPDEQPTSPSVVPSGSASPSQAPGTTARPTAARGTGGVDPAVPTHAKPPRAAPAPRPSP